MATTKLVTAEDLACLGDDRHRYDLIRGELITMSPAGELHGEIALTVGSHLWQFVRERGLGKVFAAETGFVLARNPDVLLAPDAAFVRSGRLPRRRDRSRFLEIAPDLAVEVVSPSERAGQIATKVREYLAAGVLLLWLIDPRRRVVTVYAAGQNPRILTENDDLDGGEVLPGFRLALADLFS